VEFAKALENRIQFIYKESWIYKYYNYDIKCENGVVYFYEKLKKIIVDSYRFYIYVYIPKQCRSYFYPASEWNTLFSSQSNYIETSLLSRVPHGFRTMSFPSTKSLFYSPPFFFMFNRKSQTSIDTNYMSFNSFYKPNLEDSILAMCTYNEDLDMFETHFTPNISIPSNSLILDNFEFILQDSNRKQIKISDNSQLYITITVN
jgi:hypothetical protein